MHSPDPDYEAKLAWVADLRAAVRSSPGRLVLVYLDEFTFYRQPTLANAWEERGPPQARAERSHRSNTPTRLVAGLDLLDGRVLYRRRSKIGIEDLVGFLADLRRAYPEAERIYAVQDNWPLHFHADVLVALEKQQRLWSLPRPGNWSDEPSRKARARWGQLQLPIQIVQLPTYASWTNPIEKLWRKLRQEVVHLHRLADQLEVLRLEVDRFLDRFGQGSPPLLHYVGLLPD